MTLLSPDDLQNVVDDVPGLSTFASIGIGQGPRSVRNYVDNTNTDQSSVTKFIEDNWYLGRIGNGSYDASSGRLDARGGVLDFRTRPHFRPVILNPTTGEVVRTW